VVDLLITDLGVFEIDRRGGGGVRLTEVAEGASVEEITAKTEAAFQVSL
jgi:3-oxoacid CoA-transferase subunit B